MTEAKQMEIGSKDEIQEQQGGQEFAPLQVGNYICRVGKIDFMKTPTWVGNRYDPNVLNWNYKLILLPYKTESGSPMRDTNGQVVEPLTKWIFREFNPFSLGFQKDQTPSMMRAILCHLSGQDPHGRIKLSGIILLDKEDKIVTDQEVLDKFIAESKLDPESRTLESQGYRYVPDIRMFEGKFLSCTVEINKTYNKAVRFSAVPENFTEPNEAELDEKMKSFTESYEKMEAKKNGAVAETTEDVGEVVSEDVAL